MTTARFVLKISLMNYYNENDPFAAQWLRNLIAANLIPSGFVDERSILDVKPNDLVNYDQCHFFAGIGGWSRALQIAAWPVHRKVWTGSCPCQPFSQAGKRRGFADDRHLWPYWQYLIRQCRPSVIFGEQVASATEWFRLVRSDLEAMDYAVGCVPVEAASAGADHLRDRFWFVGDRDCARADAYATEGPPWRAVSEPSRDVSNAEQQRFRGKRPGSSVGTQSGVQGTGEERERLWADARPVCLFGSEAMGIADRAGRIAGLAAGEATRYRSSSLATGGDVSDAAREQVGASGQSRQSADVGDRNGGNISDASMQRDGQQQGVRSEAGRDDSAEPFGGDGRGEFSWRIGADGKARRVESDFRLLSHGFSARMGGHGSEQIHQANEKIATYGQASSQRSTEVLLAVWQGVLSEPTPYEALGEQAGICQAEILLAFLRQLDWRGFQGDLPFSSQEKFEAAVRSVRSTTLYARTSRQWKSREQCAGQYPNALQALSWILAQHAQAAWASYRSENAQTLGLLVSGFPNRVSLLRGFGNAIDPRPAAEFIKAYMEISALTVKIRST